MRDILNKYVIGAALVAGLAMVPGMAFAQAETGESDELDEMVEEELEADGEEGKAWSVSGTLLTRAYQGMFANLENQDPGLSSPHAKDPAYAFDRWLNVYVLSGSYSLDDFSFGAEFAATHWMTPGGGSTANGPYEFRIGDPSLSASWSGYNIEPIDTKVSAGFEIGLPLSTVSRTEGLIASNSLSASLSRTFFDKLSLKYSLGGGWTPHTFEQATGETDLVGVHRENERLSDTLVSIGGVHTQFSLSNSLGASIPVWDGLRASVSYGITKFWSYHQDNDDEFTPEGEAIQTGRATADITSTSVGLSYPIGDYVSLGGGIRTQQTPKTSDNKSFRFPFWNTNGRNAAAGNGSAFQLSVTGTY